MCLLYFAGISHFFYQRISYCIELVYCYQKILQTMLYHSVTLSREIKNAVGGRRAQLDRRAKHDCRAKRDCRRICMHRRPNQCFPCYERPPVLRFPCNTYLPKDFDRGWATASDGTI